jgi:alkane 1-monooxygenase
MRPRALSYGIIYLLPLAVVVGYLYGGGWNFLAVLFAFGVIPLLDLLIGVDTRNPTPEEEAADTDARDYKLMTWFAAPVQVALLFWATWIVTHRDLTWVELAGFTLSVGITGGAQAINIAHELYHRHNQWEKFLGKTLLWTVGYMHWGLEHVSGHHSRVATFDDPATARYGESFYSFWPRTVLGSLRSSWRIETARLARRKKWPWGPRNRVLRDAVLTAALVALLAWFWGGWAVVFFVVQSVLALSLLEVVNYLEHYGLLRRKQPDGRYEKVQPIHSWNASELITNRFLFNLQRHSDHHAKPGRRYPILRHIDDAPQLPTGYAGMVLVALVPPLWFRLINPRVPEEMKDLARQESAAVA